jgi:rare lipoprotein A
VFLQNIRPAEKLYFLTFFSDEHMNQRILSSLAAVLVVATLGMPTASQADPLTGSATELDSDAEPPSSPSNPSEFNPVTTDSEGGDASQVQTVSTEVVKVGERQSGQVLETAEEIVAQIQPHEMAGRQAATLYIRSIPVLTFLGDDQPTPADESTSVGSEPTEVLIASTKIGSRPSDTDDTPGLHSLGLLAEVTAVQDQTDPVWRATTMAARVNQLHREGVDAASITVEWREGDRYIILLGNEEFAELNANTRLPDSTQDQAEDALQATNRLRRLLGNAEPLREVRGMPRPQPRQVARAAVQFRTSGLASWYGPGFHGNRSASGEIFDQNALTAAHRTLPFGTRVRVTNLETGQEVVVRINDRGPFHGNRVLDLSAGAARAIGLMQMGVAPVQMDVLDSSSAQN